MTPRIDGIETAMRIFVVLTMLALLAAAPLAAAQTPFQDAARRLDGMWRGDEHVLRIDSRRAQASIDPDRPFQWQRFLVKQVAADDEIVFTIGAELFEARLDADSLVLTSTGFQGERILRRDEAAP